MWTLATKNTHAELKLTGRKFHIHTSGENRRPSCQHGTATDTVLGCTYHASKCHKRREKNKTFRMSCRRLADCKTDFPRTVSTELITQESSRKAFLSCAYKKTSLWTISTSSWAHRHGNLPKREFQNVSVCVKGHMNYGLTLTEGLFLIDPGLIIFGRPQSSSVSRCYNVHPQSISPLAAAPTNARL